MPSPADPEFPLALADRCVKCGLCLPHCPTFAVSRDEAESPRGRIGLMQGLAGGRLQASPKLAGHLEQCLGCRSCEAVCPARVPFGALMDAARQTLAASGRPPGRLERLLRWSLSTPSILDIGGRLALLWRKTGLFAGSGTTRLHHMTRMLPARSRAAPGPGWYRCSGARGQVALFTGCVARIADGGTLRDAILVLNAAGYDVHVPERQGCCGALHQHSGDAAGFRALARNNLRAFDGRFDALVSVASGCAATLQDYPATVPDEAQRNLPPVRDFSRWVAASGWSPPGGGQRVQVALHQPCTLRNVLKSAPDTLELLRRSPDIEVTVLPGGLGCCGAAGSHMLARPALSNRVSAPLLDEIVAADPHYLATSNPGCAMHLRSGLGQRGVAAEICHPATLLARGLERELRPERR